MRLIFPKYQLSTNWTFDTLLAMQKVFVKVKRSEENWAFLANAAAQPYPTITRSRYFTSPEGFSSSGDVWYDSGEVVLTREK